MHVFEHLIQIPSGKSCIVEIEDTKYFTLYSVQCFSMCHVVPYLPSHVVITSCPSHNGERGLTATTHWTLQYSVMCTLYSTHCKMHCTLLFVHSKMCTRQCTKTHNGTQDLLPGPPWMGFWGGVKILNYTPRTSIMHCNLRKRNFNRFLFFWLGYFNSLNYFFLDFGGFNPYHKSTTALCV